MRTPSESDICEVCGLAGDHPECRERMEAFSKQRDEELIAEAEDTVAFHFHVE